MAGLRAHADPTASIAGLSWTAWIRSPDGTRLKGSRDGTRRTGSPDGTRSAATAG
jgi:hypothetical protein